MQQVRGNEDLLQVRMYLVYVSGVFDTVKTN